MIFIFFPSWKLDLLLLSSFFQTLISRHLHSLVQMTLERCKKKNTNARTHDRDMLTDSHADLPVLLLLRRRRRCVQSEKTNGY
ncbi:uncharacterized protein GLRG_00516 [Colletotrichum graminicola M1.001]|uniref:Secreted protein n=1 Tax=Colletotrichum graminicola (strain M1.001 / M2 / FGSC 10212) TaxID=645133 RepID=E3Q460_COLGM|nr:uncharacterized protein GLRG_00516 [Colletotrichum graminicola M1.001]EFQ25372.1 hypothetical protein GLRG_00516 [Colletotrichum graminicola M1.001]